MPPAWTGAAQIGVNAVMTALLVGNLLWAWLTRRRDLRTRRLLRALSLAAVVFAVASVLDALLSAHGHTRWALVAAALPWGLLAVVAMLAAVRARWN